jgi:hypothetical protein
MSAFIDSTLLRFTQDTFVQPLLTAIGPSTLLSAMYNPVDIAFDAVTLGPIVSRAYKVAVFETVRIHGTDERILPDMQRVLRDRAVPRFGRLDWIDVSLKVQLSVQTHATVAPLQSISVDSLESKVGGITSLDDLKTKLLTLYAPSVVDDLFTKLKISTFDDFAQQKHLFVELVGSALPPPNPADSANNRDFIVHVCVKIQDGFDVAGSL